jgi:RNA recognition motif-containing protein
MYKIHLGCLPASCTREQLLSYFSEFGRIRDAKVTRKSKSLCSGDGWLICHDYTTYEQLLKIKNFEFAGRTIFCEPMLTGEQLLEKNRLLSLRRIFVSNLPPHLQDHQIFEVFTEFGEVQNAYRIVSLRNEKRPFGFVTFMQQSSAVQAVQTGKIYFEQRPIYISDFKKHKPEPHGTTNQPNSTPCIRMANDKICGDNCEPITLNSLQDPEFEEDGILEFQLPGVSIQTEYNVRKIQDSTELSKVFDRNHVKKHAQPQSGFSPIKTHLGSMKSLCGINACRSAAVISTVGSLSNVNQIRICMVEQNIKPTSKTYHQRRGSSFLSNKTNHRESALSFQISPLRLNLLARRSDSRVVAESIESDRTEVVGQASSARFNIKREVIRVESIPMQLKKVGAITKGSAPPSKKH